MLGGQAPRSAPTRRAARRRRRERVEQDADAARLAPRTTRPRAPSRCPAPSPGCGCRHSHRPGATSRTSTVTAGEDSPARGAGEARVGRASPGARDPQRALALLRLRLLVDPLLLALPLLATMPVGSSGRPAALRSLRGDLGDLLGRVVGREDVGLRRQVVAAGSPRAPRRRPRASSPVSGCGPLKTAAISLVVVGREAVELEVLAAARCAAGTRGSCRSGSAATGTASIMFAPVRFSSARA